MRIVYPPTIDWNFMHQRPQQMACALGRLGHDFHYFNKTADGRGSESVAPRVTLWHDPNRLHEQLAGSVLLTSWSHHADLVGRAALTVFDNLDLFSHFAEADVRLLRAADIALCSSVDLLRRAVSVGATATLVPNACDWQHWQNPGPAPEWLAAIPEPRVLFSGALANWFDAGLLQEVASLLPDVSFVCVGVNWSSLRSARNIHCVGERRYDELPAVFGACKVGIIPFLDTPVTQAADPIKAYEYSAAGLKVVTSPLREMWNKPCRVASTPAQWRLAISSALSVGPDETARAWAKTQTWDDRAAVIDGLIRTKQKLVCKA